MTATMLRSVWRLRDVEDVEALCRGVLRELAGANYERRTSRTPATVRLEPSDWHESLAFLLGEVVILERRFEARAGIEFRPWLYQRLRWALIDEWRRWFGRQGQRRVVDEATVTSGDDGAHDDDEHEPGSDLRRDRLHGTADGDPADRTGLDRWLDPDGDRHETPAVGGASVGAGQGASGGVDLAGARPCGRARRAVAGASGAAPFVDCPGCGWRCYPEAPNGVDRWHFPAGCVACGEPLTAEVAA